MEDSADFQTINVDCDHSSVVTIEDASSCSSLSNSRWLSTSGHDSGDFLLVAVERCPLCLRVRVPIYCASCVRTGDFTSTTSSDHKMRFCQGREKIATLYAQVDHLNLKMKKFQREEFHIRDQIRVRRTHIQHIKDVIERKRNNLMRQRVALQELQYDNAQMEFSISKLNEHTEKTRKRCLQLIDYVAKRRVECNHFLDKVTMKRKYYIQNTTCNIFRIGLNKPWTEICGLKIPCLTADNYHVLDSSDGTVAALLYASLFLRSIVTILDINLPKTVDTSIFSKELLTRDEIVLVYRFLVYVAQRLFSHMPHDERSSLRNVILSDLMRVLRSPNLGRPGPHCVDRLNWVPTVNLESDENASTSNSSEWVEVPWDIPYDAASTSESQFGSMMHGVSSDSASFISSSANALSSWFSYAFGQAPK